MKIFLSGSPGERDPRAQQPGQLVEQYRYDAFGAPTIKNAAGTALNSTAINNRFLFTGREYADDFGIYEYRARAYHPGLGRFLSEDPKGFDAGDYNLYRYCSNDPLDRTDPMGLDDIVPPRGMDELGRDASLESARLGHGRYGYAQGIEYGPNGRLRLGPGPVRGLSGNYVNYTQGQRREHPAYRERIAESGDGRLAGFGHVHQDEKGYPKPHERYFSQTDFDLVKNQKVFGYLVNQSDKGTLYRLNPQTDKSNPTLTPLNIQTLKQSGPTLEAYLDKDLGTNIPTLHLRPKSEN